MRGACALVLALALALVTGGCNLDADEPKPGEPQAEKRESGGDAEPREGRKSQSEAIRAWSRALNDGDFEQAASFFADGAVVEQLDEMRLNDMDAAVAFNRSLPCKADVTDVEDEGETLVAAFRLRDGPGGPCMGAARVRFRFEAGKFAEWRQLSAPAAPDGDIARSAAFG